MQYALLIYTPEPTEEPSREAHARADGGLRRLHASICATAARCWRARRSIRRRRRRPCASSTAGPSPPTGPFAETKETLGGFYLVEAADLDEAIAYAAMIPGARHGCIEVRPVWDSRRSRAANRPPPRPRTDGLTAAATRLLTGSEAAHEVVDRLFREEQGRAVATLIRVTRRLRPGRGGRPGRVHQRPRDVARAGRPGQPRRVDHDDGSQPGDRPASPASAVGREDRGRSGGRPPSRPELAAIDPTPPRRMRCRSRTIDCG